jgi:hypothetical protein
MYLLQFGDDNDFSLVEYIGNSIPRYAILSHTWGSDNEEITFQDIKSGTGKGKAGYRKIRFCGTRAASDGLQHFWVDTCCIDKSSSAELHEAINSMFRWYQNAERCYVYLSDVSDGISSRDNELSRSWKPPFRESRWFTRGWTLQELIAPLSVEFFSKEGTCLGNKQSLEQTLHEVTGIALNALRGPSLSQFSKDERFAWAAERQTKREEDAAYCLLGIFGVFMPLIYGEGRKNALARLEEQIEKSSKDALLSLDEEQKRILIDSLRFDQMDARQMTIKNAHSKTCNWLLKKSEYLDWLNTDRLNEHHGFLWIRGKPGTGKSTLMKFALAHARKTMVGKVVISFFFNARGEDIEKSTVGTYRSLLLELLERFPALQRVFDSLSLSKSSIGPNYKWSIGSLQVALEAAIMLLGDCSVVCFIDALDECEEQQIRDMIQFFEHIGELTVLAGIDFQVCFSSRHYPHITIWKGLGLVLEGQEGHSQDITYYLESELNIGQSKIAQQIRSELQEKASGVFMWVVLVVSILNKEHDRGRVHVLRRRLQEIPGDLHDLFRDTLTRDSHNKDELVLCLQWVLFAKQPLSPEQLYFAILSGVDPEALSWWDQDEIARDVIEKFILDSSKGLVEITTSKASTVQFIHESVKDFLWKENGLGKIWSDLASNFEEQSHERLKQCCLSYMNVVFTHLEIPKSLPKASSQEAAHNRQLLTSAFPFLKYTVRNVLYHADAAERGGIVQTSFLQSFPLANWIKLGNLCEHEVRTHTQHVSLLYVLAEMDTPNLIKVYPSNLLYLKAEKERYGPPLFAALATGSEEAVRAFVEVHAATLTPGSWLHSLCSQYCPNISRRWKFRHHFEFSNQRTLLSYLGELGDEVLFALALETGKFMPDLRDQDGRTPLSWATRNGRWAVVKLLLETGKVDIDSKDQDGRTPLSWAAQNGYEAVVKMLLETAKVDIDLKDQDGRTPLSWAARNGSKTVVKMLLETAKVDIDLKDQDGRTPLSWAARNGYEAVVKLLLDTGKVDINSEDQNGRTPLLWAAQNGHKGVVKMLRSYPYLLR